MNINLPACEYFTIMYNYNIYIGNWSSLGVTGNAPNGNAYFTFTKVSDRQVIRYGGQYDNAIHLLDLSSMVSM